MQKNNGVETAYLRLLTLGATTNKFLVLAIFFCFIFQISDHNTDGPNKKIYSFISGLIYTSSNSASGV